MSVDWTLLPILAIIFVATLIRSAFGFGEALLAVPLLARILPVKVAAPVAVLVSIMVAAIVVVQDWHKIHVRSAWRLILATLPGIPLGLLLLIAVEEYIVKAILALVIIGFSTFCLIRRMPFELKHDRLAWLFGLAAGVLGGAYGMNGPPLVVYGALRRWSPEHFRATLQGYFLPASVIGMVGYGLAGLWVPAVTGYFLLSLPVALAAIFLGRVLNRRLDARRFIVYVHAGLILIGITLLAQSVATATTTPSHFASKQALQFFSGAKTSSSRVEMQQLTFTALSLMPRAEDDPKAPPSKPKRDDALRAELLRMVKEDQEARKEAIKASADDSPAHRKMVEIDRRNTARMKEIIEKYGWPGNSLVGEEGAHAAWLLVQHADRERAFQKRCLTLLEGAVKEREAAPVDLAYLTDRVRVAENKKQVYGTQFRQVEGKLEPYPIEDEKNVDRRRKELGLPPLAEYRRVIEEMYKPKTKQP
jgi:uncharacterized protein